MDVDASSWAIGAWRKFFAFKIMATPSIDDDLDGSSIDVGLGVEYVASLVFFLVMLESQNLGDNKGGT